jgi:NAD(P)-dependent dehydrogenase (short-subunit alcohol dehydrogenase family)
MQGKTIVATGATSGISAVAVLELASIGARVVFIARDAGRVEATLRKLETRAPRLGRRVHLADLSSMAETRRVGEAIAASEPRIDVLINNAGAMFGARRETPEGLELTFALNHVAYFLLTAALSDKLAASAPARIVSTASNAHQAAKLDLNHLQSARDYSGWRAYARSKLANILFTRELAQPSRRNRRQRQLPPPWLRRIALRRLGWRPDKLDHAARQIFCDLVSKRRRHHRSSCLVPRRCGSHRPIFRQTEGCRTVGRGPRRRRREEALGGERGARGFEVMNQARAASGPRLPARAR